MKDFYIANAAEQENKVIISSFVVASKQVKAKKTGEPYLALTLSDRTGQLEAKMWDNVTGVLEAFEQDDFIKVKGLLNKYDGRFQLTIHRLRRLEEHEVDPADYPPKCKTTPVTKAQSIQHSAECTCSMTKVVTGVGPSDWERLHHPSCPASASQPPMVYHAGIGWVLQSASAAALAKKPPVSGVRAYLCRMEGCGQLVTHLLNGIPVCTQHYR